MTQNIVEILNFKVSNKLPLFLIAGPCSIESKDHAILIMNKSPQMFLMTLKLLNHLK